MKMHQLMQTSSYSACHQPNEVLSLYLRVDGSVTILKMRKLSLRIIHWFPHTLCPSKGKELNKNFCPSSQSTLHHEQMHHRMLEHPLSRSGDALLEKREASLK